jgi:hypothetical protein
MKETIYPGSRLATGGGMSLSSLLQGYSNIYTIYNEHLTGTNQSEVSGFLTFMLPLFALSAIYIKRKGNYSILVIMFLLCLAAILYYQFVGIPVLLSKISFFSYVTSNRLIIAVGFIELILLAIFIRAHTELDGKLDFGTVRSSVIALIWAATIIFSIRRADYYDSTLQLFLLPIGFAAFLINYWLLKGKIAQFLVLALLWSLSMSLPFNPIVRLPSQFTLRPEIEALISSRRSGGILVLSANTAAAMYYAAAGVRITNGVFYYPPKSLWSRLDPNNELTRVHNRYQHLVFNIDASLDKDIKYLVPQPDLIVANINPTLFDFNKTGASMVTIPSALETFMNSNPSLRPHGKANGWSFFNVTPIASDLISDFRQK